MLSKASVFLRSLISLLVNMWFQRRGVSWSVFVVSLTTIRLSRRNRNSLWSWFYAHNFKFLFNMFTSLLYGVEAPPFFKNW